MKVLLIVIDAATARVVAPAISTGQLPTMQRLAEMGCLHESVTMFPSITPAATASIITGHYPAGSGIVGASWYDEAAEKVAYFGDDFWVVAREGFRPFLRDFLIGLNGDRLKAPTLFQHVERAGKTAMCLNYLVFKGEVEHVVKIPWLLAMLPGVPRTEVIQGPSVFCLGDFVATRTMRGAPLVDKSGLLHRFGMDDASTGQMLVEVAEDRAFADFNVAYFADNDYRSHEIGPHAALKVVEAVDCSLARMFEAAGSMERMLKDTYVIVTSDHGHCEIVGDADRATIHLDAILGEFRQAALGEPWHEGDEIMICPNMRAAEIYVRRHDHASVARIIERALVDPRVDQAFWRAPGEGSSRHAYAARNVNAELTFWRGSGDHSASDAFGTVWSWRGDLSVLDAHVEDGELRWKDYPNAFERIAGALDAPNSGDVWFTARPGCEFEVPGGAAHVGGASHGALHALESWCPFLIAGPTRVPLPSQFRSVDIAPLCLELLGIPSPFRVGEPRH
ncbi:MAG TPA: alkaline phosphatase family protein [Vicinamibacterales bacterium]|nr:alkaline phosphatase family protein [Vicinamibacterales bacterium]